MKDRCLWFVCLCMTLLTVSCGNKREGDIEKDMASGVVLVQNRGFYEVALSNGESLYFSGFDDGGRLKGLTVYRDSVESLSSYGTGFFISTKGEIVTNAHVVSGEIGENGEGKSEEKTLTALKDALTARYYALDAQLGRAEQYYRYVNYTQEAGYEEFYKVKALCYALRAERDKCRAYYIAVGMIKAGDNAIKYHNTVSVAYNNAYVKSAEDFLPCAIKKKDAEHDIAIIQLESKTTPEGKYIFEVPDDDPLESYSLKEKVVSRVGDDKNDRVFMTSFNFGPALAITKDGVRSQFNSGTISQRTRERLLYSIPALPGSSGSPVVNHEGQLVAINYAGLNGTQGFNYGVRVKHLRNLLEK